MKPIDRTRLEALRIDTVLAGANLAALRPRFERLAARHENGTAPRAVSAFQLFQTPAEVARRLVAAAGVLPGMRVLEPSCGLGRILDALPRCEVVAVERSPTIAGEVFRQNRDGVTLLQRDFLACHPGELGTFDRVVMNPPFHMRADVRHIEHALGFLRPGGVLAAICMAGPRRDAVLRPRASTWVPLGRETFAKEGTHVETILLTITKPFSL
jgi:predicted RNA methylase